ncbi:MAG: hypothetical protein ABSE73_27720 [Planctomycetota bacterium]
MGDERLYHLGLLHLKDKPKELIAEVKKRRQKYEDRRQRLKESLDKTSQKQEEHPKELNQAAEAHVNAPPLGSQPLRTVLAQREAAAAPSGKKA